MRRAVTLAAALALTLPHAASAQDSLLGSGGPSHAEGDRISERGVPVLRAVRVPSTEPVIDGRLDEAAWAAAPVADEFVQFQPEEGSDATERTEARVLYGADALFVAIRAFDGAPDSIVGQLTRRDQSSHSDQVGVIVDSYFDRRTAFQFTVNPVGVKEDVYRYDDTGEDRGWDAVWDVATSRDDGGWSAEFRIPYSQLRFRDAPTQTWGINFLRRIARHQEMDVWAPTARSEAAVVSRFGELRGLKDIEPPRRLEVTPYSLARVQRAPGEEDDPFHEPTAFTGTVGADARYGITSDLTLDLTVNPDFGQVEADPAQVNLSAFETFLPERRPFFVEGSNLFDFSLALGDGDDAVESLFYSRRIGRVPHGNPDERGGYEDIPENTTILGAVKLSGKTAGGWSIGTLAAVTGEEEARVAPAVGGRETPVVEPRTRYGVARLQKDFREGRSALGLIGTAVSRDAPTADALGIRREAFTGGVDFRHRFGGDGYVVQGHLLGSRVSGSPDAILRTQLSSARYFQRPDAEHVELDPERRSLAGFSAQAGLSKITGHWRWGGLFQTRSPGFEANDAGFMREADFTTLVAYGGYDQSTPMGPFRRWRLNTNLWRSVTHGWEHQGTGGNVNGSFQLRNFWSGHAGVNYNAGGYSSAILRGGPLLRKSTQLSGWGGFNTDSRKDLRLGVSTNWFHRGADGSWLVRLAPRVSVRPSASADVQVGAFFSRTVEARQWVEAVDAGGAHYLFGELDQSTVGLTARVDLAFTPTLSLQLYAQPFVSAGDFWGFKEVAEPRARDVGDRFAPVDARRGADGRYRADLNGDGTPESWGDPDFNVKQFRSNAVLRWEYRPGSTLFLVWSQGRNHGIRDGSFDMRRDLGRLFDAPGDDILMLKVTYWMNP